MKPIRAVAFDVDGTLYPNHAMYLRSIPFALGHARLIHAYSKMRRRVRDIRPLEDLGVAERELLAEELGVSREEAGRLIDVEIHEKWETVFQRVRLYPHVREVIEHLIESGMRVAVASDLHVEMKLKRLGLADLFECQMWTGQSGYLKPHPEPFQALAECFAVPVDEFLYVGNSYEYDVLGARAAGMRTAHLRRNPVRNSVADLTFRDYRTLASWIDSVNATGNPPTEE